MILCSLSNKHNVKENVQKTQTPIKPIKLLIRHLPFPPPLTKKVKSRYKPSGPSDWWFISSFCTMKWLRVFLVYHRDHTHYLCKYLVIQPGEASHCKSNVSCPGTAWTCLARAPTQTTQSGDEYTNREVTVPPFPQRWLLNRGSSIKHYNTICFKSYLYLCYRYLAYFSL